MLVPPSVFAVDERRLRLARFLSNGAGFELADYRAVGLEPDLFATGPVGGPMHDTERFRAALAGLQAKVGELPSEACLVLPDTWLRVALVDADELPRKSEEREEVLKWKLQRMVPFRVEELRVRGAVGGARAISQPERRVVLGFGLESLLRQLETVFEDRGVHIGYISSDSLMLLAALEEVLRGVQLGVVAFVSPRGYSLTFVLHGEPVLHRFKALPQLAGDEPPRQLVERDLKLTRMYLADQFPGTEVDRLLLVGPAEIEDRWLDWLGHGFGVPAHAVRIEHLPFSPGRFQVPLFEVAPLLGAARQEVE